MELFAQANRGAEALAPCILVAVVGVIAAVVLFSRWTRRASFRRELARVARHLQGRVVAHDFFAGFSEVHFAHNGMPAVIRFSRRGRNRHYTHVESAWSGTRYRCEIYPEDFLSSLRKLIGMQDIVIGSPPFDSAFVITGDDVPGIKALLNGQVQGAIFNLAGYVRGMHVQFSSRSLTVTCRGLLSDFVRVAELVKRCRELADAAVAAQGQGIEFLDREPLAATAGTAGEAHCMVCGEGLSSQIVYCRSCQTPHHRECWSYGGGCSTYGCGEKKFVTKG